jgi:hypothetical protein
VSSFCTAALTAVEKLVHPPSGTLNFPVSLKEMLESTKRYRQEYPTKAKMLRTSAETSEEEEVKNDVHKREGSSGSEQAASHAYHASSSSEEVVLVYENKMEVEDYETDEFEEEKVPECEVVSLVSEESDGCLENKTAESCGLSKVFSYMHDEQEDSLVDTVDSDEEIQHNEVGSPSVIDISDEKGQCSNVGDFKKGMSQNCNSKDNKIQCATLIHFNKEPPSIAFTKPKKKIGTSCDLSNEDKLISYQQQKGTTESCANASNICQNIIYASTEKESKEIAASTEVCTAKRTLLVTENEEDREDNDDVLHIIQKDDDNEPDPKKIKLDSPESVEKYCKPNAETAKTDSHGNVEDITAVPITQNNEQQAVNGVDVDPKDVTEEEMLQAFVDVLSD